MIQENDSAGDYHGQPGAAAFGDVEIGVRTAEYHDWIGCRMPVREQPQAPPDASWIDDADAPSGREQLLGETLGGRGLTAAGLSYDPDVVAKGLVWENLSPIRHRR